MKKIFGVGLNVALLTLIFAGSSVSCSSKNENSTGSEVSEAKQDSFKSSSLFSKNYMLTGYDGCKTGPQEIKGDSKEELNSKYCFLLQSGDANNHCAESQRLELFITNCDNSWEPKETLLGLDVATERAGQSFVSLYDGSKMDKNRLHLKVKETKIVDGLSAGEITRGNAIVDSLTICGFSDTCLMSIESPQSIAISFDYINSNPENVSLMIASLGEPQSKDMELPPIDIVFRYPGKDLEVPPTVEVWEKFYPRGFRSYREYFEHSISAKKLLEISTVSALK